MDPANQPSHREPGTGPEKDEGWGAESGEQGILCKNSVAFE